MDDKKVAKKHTNLDNLMSLIYSFDVLIRYLELQLFPHSTNSIRFAIMSAIITNGGEMSPTAISKRVFRSPRTITSTLDSLERDGLVRRRPNPTDRRGVNVVVTKKGWKSARTMVPVAQEISERIFSCFTEHELETAVGLFRKLRKHALAEIGGKAFPRSKPR